MWYAAIVPDNRQVHCIRAREERVYEAIMLVRGQSTDEPL